jgi:5-oxoprolinase (ATP-hydrolysing)
MSKQWEFWIDVGGTFTDAIAYAPDGRLSTCKVLSSGVTRGRGRWDPVHRSLTDEARRSHPSGFFEGYGVRLLDDSGHVVASGSVRKHDAAEGRLDLNRVAIGDAVIDVSYELVSPEEAPVLAIRTLLGLPLDAELSPCRVKLGTTRGTNALLERKGARTAFITNQGFGDLLRIGNQARPKLFELNIRKPEPLFETVVEVAGRLDATGRELLALDWESLRRSLVALKQQGIVSLAVCLLHAWRNPDHELQVGQLASECGFEEVSLSHHVAPRIKAVSRGDTTVVDAYLNPVLRDYVSRMQISIGQSKLQVMTSAGGLVEAAAFRGKDSILSGPAGGVVGYSRIAALAGFQQAIGFDMGGTSTDVSRFAGEFEREFENSKAGVRIVAPMLAIETVAAGGGSICGFDGVSLFVGPNSAGADPGPACYGGGGPLTVTDCNVALGRVLPERFPFKLDTAVVHRRLKSLCDEIATSPLGCRYSPIELAQGFIDIANAHMERAIRQISVARGFDPGEHVLVTFGGAGGQHPCALARQLGIRQILIHPMASVLSALGMGLADVRRTGELSVLHELNNTSLDEARLKWREIADNLRDEILAEGVPESSLDPAAVTFELRYLGQEATLLVRPQSVDALTAEILAEQFESEHQRQFGYRRSGRAIELCVVHVERVGRLPELQWPIESAVARQPAPSKTIRVWFTGRETPAGLFERERLHAGDRIQGPAIISEPNSSIVIEPGFRAEMSERGDFLITAEAQQAGEIHTAEKTGVDPVRLEIFRNQFASIAEQMGTTLQRTSVSTNVKERLDFSCGIFDPQGRLVVNAPHIPVHLGAIGETVQAILRLNPDLAPGDVFVTNDPYQGGSHLPDVTVITPVHDASGELICLTASRAHHAEIGGIVPGSMPPFSKTLGEEGVLIANFKLVAAGVSREEKLAKLLTSGPYPTRNLKDNLADITAQIAANQLGATRLLELVARESLAVVQLSMDQLRQISAEKMRIALARLPEGCHKFVDHLDDGTPIAVSITTAGDRATIDFTGSGPVLESNLNANRAIVTAACMYVLRCLIDEEIPLNSGVLEPVEIIVPEGVLNPPPREPMSASPAMVGGNVETSQRIVDVLLGAFNMAAASQGTMNNLTFGDSSFGYYETICGGSGATSERAGADAVHTHMTNTRLTDVEVLEHRYPVRVLEFSIRHGSGGRGLHRGGDGIKRRIEFLRPIKMSILSQRRGPYAPFGTGGGQEGALGVNSLARAGGETIDLGGRAQIEVAAGDVLTIETPGGGGWGEIPPHPDSHTDRNVFTIRLVTRSAAVEPSTR